MVFLDQPRTSTILPPYRVAVLKNWNEIAARVAPIEALEQSALVIFVIKKQTAQGPPSSPGMVAGQWYFI